MSFNDTVTIVRGYSFYFLMQQWDGRDLLAHQIVMRLPCMHRRPVLELMHKVFHQLLAPTLIQRMICHSRLAMVKLAD